MLSGFITPIIASLQEEKRSINARIDAAIVALGGGKRRGRPPGSRAKSPADAIINTVAAKKAEPKKRTTKKRATQA